MTSSSNRKRRRPVYSATLPPRLVEQVRQLAHAHRQPVSREIEDAIRARVNRRSGK